MRGVARVRGRDTQRVRRWDVVVLGASLPGLVAAVRLGRSGARVLVLEEKAAAEAPPLLREPFALAGAESTGVLGSCLQSLGLPLIDRRRFAPTDVAVQVVLPDARIDFGRAALTAAELTAWGLAKPDEAKVLVRALERAALAEQAVLWEDDEASPRKRRRDARERTAKPGLGRGWPREASEAGASLQVVLGALTRALSNLGASAPSPEARAHLIGSLLQGGAVLGGGDPCLLSMIRRRAQSLFAEFRTLERPVEWVSVANQPGLSLRDPDEILAGRVLVLNAPLAGLRRITAGEAPEFLAGPEPALRRTLRHWRGPAEVLPEGMEARLVCVPATRGDGSPEQAPVVTLRRQPGPRAGDVDLVAQTVAPVDAPPGEVEGWIDRVLERLVPFADGRLVAQRTPAPLWDTDALLVDPPRGSGGGGNAGWPALRSTRLSGRLPIHHLDRSWVGGLGFEGDLWLGLRAADAIAADLP